MKILSLLKTKELLNQADTSDLLHEMDDNLRKQLQCCLLKALSEIDEVCKENGIEIFLSGGSALGAVRHQGFIPWDDDVDVAMTRADYMKFIPVFEEQLSERYVLCAPNYHGSAIARFPKILIRDSYLSSLLNSKDLEYRKIFIDIFILENTPANKFARTVRGIACMAAEAISSMVFFVQNADEDAKKLYKKAGSRNYLFRVVIGTLFSFLPAYKWFDLVDSLCSYQGESALVCFPTGRKHYFGEIMEKEKLFPLKQVPFENLQFNVFSGFDYYLSNLYGDYMAIPPVEKREKHFIREIRFPENAG